MRPKFFLKLTDFFASFFKSRKSLLLVAAVVGLIGWTIQIFPASNQTATPGASSAMAGAAPLIGLGKLEPESKVIQLTAPTSTGETRLARLLVEEGDQVQNGQLIAVLESEPHLQAQLWEAQQRVAVQQAELARVQAGQSGSRIQAQQATVERLQSAWMANLTAQHAGIARLQTEVDHACLEYQRYERLLQSGDIAQSVLDEKKLRWDVAQNSLKEAEAQLSRIQSADGLQIVEAQATLDQIAEVRAVDRQVAATNLAAAQATVMRLEVSLAQAYVKAPCAGQILKIHTRSGEKISNQGIAEMGNTRRMYALAEIYETDIGRVKIGQSAQVQCQSIAQPLSGVVEAIGLLVKRQEVVNTDPAANTDARVVEVRIKLDEASSTRASQFTNHQVTVRIVQ
ncbi:MAG TPA: HlyD family efflux transporter periplasmic adaptor subunit [Acidobacteriota bacterium]|nr:HlyD family efflux transporter periplasmic adaptor subunit [Acidobacteriota bacterium]